MKTDEQLKKEMIKKVDLSKMKKLYAMSFKLQDSEVKGFEKILEQWADNKLWLYKLLGENLKIEKEINIDAETVRKIKKDDDELSNTELNYTLFTDFINKTNEKIPIFAWAMNEIFNYSDTTKKLPYVNEDCFYHHYFDEKKINYDKDGYITFSKVMKILFNNEIVDTEVSKLIQQISGNITGKLYISIDPFDYLTMSMNKSKWSSCHSLHSDINSSFIDWGCYSAGIFSYMCDEVSMIAYRTNGNKEKMGWNNRSLMVESKNWRQMIFLHKDLNYFISSRQYPFKSEIICKLIREMLENILDKKAEVEEENKRIKKDNKWIVSRNTSRNKSIIKNIDFDSEYFSSEDEEDNDDYETLHYNDMLHGFSYQLTYKESYDNLNKIFIGSHPVCPICGENILNLHRYPFCINCKAEKDIREGR